MKMRTIEMLLAWDDGTWTTRFLDIPADTPEGEIDRVAVDAAITKVTRSDFGDTLVLAAVYNIPEIE